MSYEYKVAKLVPALTPHIEFGSDDLPSAEEVRDAYKMGIGSDVQSKIDALAIRFYERSDQFGIRTLLLTIGECRETKLSAIREAIRICAISSLGPVESDELTSQLVSA